MKKSELYASVGTVVVCGIVLAILLLFGFSISKKDMDEGLATANEEVQAKYYGDAQKIAWEACPWLFLGNDQIIYSTKSYLSGVYVSPDGAFNFANATLAQ